MTTPDPSSLCESLAEARSLMVTLELRIATLERSIDDLFELSVLTTSVRTIDELLSIAYGDVPGRGVSFLARGAL
jgi:hypothetical protein